MDHPHRHETRSDLFWCDSCNAPLVGRSCGKCGRSGRMVELSPPGEVRLALEGTRRRLRYLFLRQFGVQQLVPDIFVLNKASGDDRAEEIIVDGRRIALLTYDLESSDYRLMLRIDGARMLAPLNPKKLITLRKVPGHIKGKHIPPEMMESIDPGIRAGDEVVVMMGKFIGCGSAKVDASEMRSKPRGMKVRDFSQAGPLTSGRKAWPKDLIRANREHLAAKKARAEHELRQVMASRPELPVTVSFSGGKDSLVVLDIVSSIRRDFATMFIDTGLEHPWTREYVTKFSRSCGTPFLTASAGDAFDDNFAFFGPPAKDFRWCCKVCKLAPVSELVAERFPKGTLTVEGNRRLESFSRAKLELVEENPFVPGQVTVNPIRDWTGLDVWLYILWRGLEFNPLYLEDIERVGCWMCPSALASETAEISRLTPELAKAWNAQLHSWAEANEIPRGVVDYGLWRWKVLPPKMRALADRLGLEVKPKRADTIEIRVLKGLSPCAAGGYSVDAVLMLPGSRGLKHVSELLKTVGEVSLVEDFGVAIVKRRRAGAKVFAGGQITVVADTPDDAFEFFDAVARAVLRGDVCTECGTCVRTCESGAITLDGSIRVDAHKCTQCGKCAASCVVAHYFDKLAGEMDRSRKQRRSSPRG